MGGTTWSGATYAANTGAKIKAGATFGYDRTAKASGTYKAHKDLDPKRVAGPTSALAGQPVREARDSDVHPNALPLIIGFDNTGSMHTVPRTVQKKLAGVYQLLLTKGYAEDPTVAISAYGDAVYDRVPLQISQFESGNEIEQCLDNLLLEGGGGGNGGETANLLWYYAAYHTHTDAFEKRGKKGYMFTIADEVALPFKTEWAKDAIGMDEAKAGLTNEQIVADLKKKWEPFVLLVNNGTAKMQGSEAFYTKLFGKDRVILVEDENNIAELIALVIGRMEDTVDMDDAEQDLIDAGATRGNALAVVKATGHIGGARGAVVKGNVDFGAATKGAARL